jgi:hypothetical protein
MKLAVRACAEQRGHTMSSLARAAQLNIALIRRYWYETADGKTDGPPLKEIKIEAIDAIARALGVSPRDLIASE